MHRRAIAAVVLVMALAPAGIATMSDDDAGSGGDAGSVASAATPVAPGSFSGRLTWPHDSADWYVLEAASDSILVVGFFASDPNLQLEIYAPDRTLMFLVPSDFTYRLALPVGGLWRFAAVLPTVALTEEGPVVRSESVAYTVVLGIEGAADTPRIFGGGPAQVIEATWSERREVTLYLRVALAGNLSAPASTGYLLEAEAGDAGVHGPFRLRDSLFVVTGATGERVVVEPLGFESTTGFPSVPGHVAREVSGGYAWTIWSFATDYGRVRITTFDTSPAPSSSAFLAPDGPISAAVHGGSGAFLWSDASNDPGPALASPGLSVSGGREHVRSIAARTYAGFYTWSASGSITSPAGHTTEVDRTSPFLFLHDPAPGAWTFRVGETTDAGTRAARAYLGGAQVPDLGVFGPPIEFVV